MNILFLYILLEQYKTCNCRQPTTEIFKYAKELADKNIKRMVKLIYGLNEESYELLIINVFILSTLDIEQALKPLIVHPIDSEYLFIYSEVIAQAKKLQIYLNDLFLVENESEIEERWHTNVIRGIVVSIKNFLFGFSVIPQNPSLIDIFCYYFMTCDMKADIYEHIKQNSNHNILECLITTCALWVDGLIIEREKTD